MHIGGLQKLSLIDFPGRLSAIVFTIGCNWRCPFCHNWELVLPEEIKKLKEIKEAQVFEFLEKRRGFLDGVEITGGEPTLQKDLRQFIERVKGMGYAVKLDTNGTNSQILGDLLKRGLLDYVAMDIKTRLEFERYNEMVGGVLTRGGFEEIKRSIKIIMNSNIEYEFRTTAIRGIHQPKDFVEICKSIKGARLYTIQKFIPENTLDKSFKKFEAFSEEEVKGIIQEIEGLVREVKYRG